MSRTDDFLDAFAAIEKHLRSATHADRHVGFSATIDRVASSDPAVRRFQDDLREFADLRNAIIHERSDGHPIADPNERAVRDILRLRDLLLAPPRLAPKFIQPVFCVSLAAPIGVTASEMTRRGFSQAPVTHDGRCVGLLSANTIARWLGASVKEEIVSLTEVTVADVMKHTEDPEHCKFANREKSLFEILELFERHEALGKRLEAIIVTAQGTDDQALLGIVTIFDLPTLIRETSLSGGR